jgi:hypothetical protein
LTRVATKITKSEELNHEGHEAHGVFSKGSAIDSVLLRGLCVLRCE